MGATVSLGGTSKAESVYKYSQNIINTCIQFYINDVDSEKNVS